MWVPTDRLVRALIDANIKGVITGFELAKSHPELKLEDLIQKMEN